MVNLPFLLKGISAATMDHVQYRHTSENHRAVYSVICICTVQYDGQAPDSGVQSTEIRGR